MNDVFSPDPRGGMVAALGTLRHALADPLSAAGLKLELLERHLAADATDRSPLADRVRGVKSDLALAGRLLDLLTRLANIVGEAPAETSIGELCRVAGLPLEEDAASRAPLVLRRLASVDALRIVIGFVRSMDRAGTPPRLRAEAASARASLRVEGPCGPGDPNLERLLHLPRSDERAQELFLARAGVESDGGRLRLEERDGLIVALLSWPRRAPAAEAGAPA